MTANQYKGIIGADGYVLPLPTTGTVSPFTEGALNFTASDEEMQAAQAKFEETQLAQLNQAAGIVTPEKVAQGVTEIVENKAKGSGKKKASGGKATDIDNPLATLDAIAESIAQQNADKYDERGAASGMTLAQSVEALGK